MSINRQDVEQEAAKILADRSWKGHLTMGIVFLVIWAIVSSPLFTLLRAILELILVFGGIGFILWALYQYFQLQEKK